MNFIGTCFTWENIDFKHYAANCRHRRITGTRDNDIGVITGLVFSFWVSGGFLLGRTPSDQQGRRG